LWLNQTHVIWFKSRGRKTLVARCVRHRELAGDQVHLVGTDRNFAQPRTKCFLVDVVIPRLVMVDAVTGNPYKMADKIVRHKLAELFEVRPVRHRALCFGASFRGDAVRNEREFSAGNRPAKPLAYLLSKTIGTVNSVEFNGLPL